MHHTRQVQQKCGLQNNKKNFFLNLHGLVHKFIIINMLNPRVTYNLTIQHKQCYVNHHNGQCLTLPLLLLRARYPYWFVFAVVFVRGISTTLLSSCGLAVLQRCVFIFKAYPTNYIHCDKHKHSLINECHKVVKRCLCVLCQGVLAQKHYLLSYFKSTFYFSALFILHITEPHPLN